MKNNQVALMYFTLVLILVAPHMSAWLANILAGIMLVQGIRYANKD